MTEAAPDIFGLARAYDSDAQMRAFIDYLASRERNPRNGTTKADLLIRELRMTLEDAIRVLRTFAESGCGHFVPGRPKSASRLNWDEGVVATDLAKQTLVSKSFPTTVSSAPSQSVRPSEVPTSRSRIQEHVFNLRPDYKAEIRLPEDLSRTEADRLANFIRTLPFDGPS